MISRSQIELRLYEGLDSDETCCYIYTPGQLLKFQDIKQNLFFEKYNPYMYDNKPVNESDEYFTPDSFISKVWISKSFHKEYHKTALKLSTRQEKKVRDLITMMLIKGVPAYAEVKVESPFVLVVCIDGQKRIEIKGLPANEENKEFSKTAASNTSDIINKIYSVFGLLKNKFNESNQTKIISIEEFYQNLFSPQMAKPLVLPDAIKYLVLYFENAQKETCFFETNLNVGRNSKNQIMLSDAAISRMHASIQYDQQEKSWTVCDLKSTNGTKLNQVQLEPLQRYILKINDVIELADTFKILVKDLNP